LGVMAVWDGSGDTDYGLVTADPRLAALGVRFLMPVGRDGEIAAAGFARADAATYDRHRLALGVPDGSRDLEIEKSILLENGLEELNGVDFNKGCYMGQELTARTKYRALIKKRLVPVKLEGPLPAPGTPVMRDGEEVGELRSGRDGVALAMLKLDALAGPLSAGDAKLTPQPPAWMNLG
ncbi:MAG: YgfZ/GcvT domain-containing protein, partial [Stellaceae bacterium]